MCYNWPFNYLSAYHIALVVINMLQEVNLVQSGLVDGFLLHTPSTGTGRPLAV